MPPTSTPTPPSGRRSGSASSSTTGWSARCEQRIDYPLQLMVDLFEFPEGTYRDPAAYPKVADVRAVRGFRHAVRLDVLPPSDPRAERALHAYMAEMSSRWLGRPASDDDVREALREFPSDALEPPRGVLVVAHRGDAVEGCAGLCFTGDGSGEVKRVVRRAVPPPAGTWAPASWPRSSASPASGASASCASTRAAIWSRPAASTSRSATARSRRSATTGTAQPLVRGATQRMNGPGSS